jgi:hypothetical protein
MNEFDCEALANNIDRSKQKQSEKNLSLCHSVIDWPRIEPRSRGDYPATNSLRHGTNKRTEEEKSW